MSQVSTHTATSPSQPIRLPARPTFRLSRLSRIPFWVWASTYAGVGSAVVVTFSR